MTARFNSPCPGCGEQINAGDEITKSGRRFVCASCAANGTTVGKPSRRPSYKQRYGRCEDAPCCGCCDPYGGSSLRAY